MTEPFIPHNRGAEEALVGAVLINPEAYYEVAQIVSAGDFHIHKNRWIWEAFDALVADHKAVDFVTVSDELADAGVLAEIGGPAYLTALLNQVPSSLNARSYAEIVAGFAVRRNTITVANEAAQSACNLSQDHDPSIFAAKFAIGAKVSARKTGNDAVGRIYKILFEEAGQRLLTFGVPRLDKRFSGMSVKELTTIAGDQGSGKTALAIWIARANAATGKKVVFASLEMPNETVWLRMACGDLGVNLKQVRAGKVTEETKVQVYQKVEELEKLYQGKIIVYEDPMTMLAIQAAAIREQPDLVVVDHADLVVGMREGTGPEKIAALNELARFLRQNVAKPEPGSHVILLWQLGRSHVKERRKPGKHDLWFAGTQDPDDIYLLYRPDLYQDKVGDDNVPLEIIPGKARNDSLASEEITYDLIHQSFHDKGYKGDNPF